MASAIQNCTLQLCVDVKPDITGPSSGPMFEVNPSSVTALPVERGLCKDLQIALLHTAS
jgi:hypothetical protein